MHTEVFNNIDILINMAASPLNIDEITVELNSIARQIKNKTNEIEDLKGLMSDARYFDASNELVDKNIEVSLKNKINRLNRQIKEVKNTLTEIENSKNSLQSDVTGLNKRLTKNEEYVRTLKIKADQAKSNTYYLDLLKKEEENVSQLSEALAKKEAEYDQIQKEFTDNEATYQGLTAKLELEQSRLSDITDNLDNPNTYIDTELKKADEARVATLTEELQQLEKRRVELLTDPNSIGYDAKELIEDDDLIEALNKVRELVTLVKTKPYMSVTNPSILSEELEKKEQERLELSTLIDNKNYEGLDTTQLTKRLDYLKDEINNHEKTINKYQEEIDDLDTFVNKNLGPMINDLESEILSVEESISKYRALLKEKNKTLRSKANLENALSKKDQEKSILNDILTAYKDNLVSKIKHTNVLNDLITSLTTEIEHFKHEIATLEKLTNLSFKSKDLVAEENDKEKLKQLNDEIKSIKNRQKFNKNPDEIYDQIEMALAINPEKKLKKDDFLDTPIYDYLDASPEAKRLKVIEMIPVETVKKGVGGN